MRHDGGLQPGLEKKLSRIQSDVLDPTDGDALRKNAAQSRGGNQIPDLRMAVPAQIMQIQIMAVAAFDDPIFAVGARDTEAATELSES